MMFKALLLQAWYGLSDPGLEKQLARDLLFRRFIDLSLSESVPDHSTFWRFRNLLEAEGFGGLLTRSPLGSGPALQRLVAGWQEQGLAAFFVVRS